VETCRPALSLKRHSLTYPALVLVLSTGCASSVDNRHRSSDQSGGLGFGQGELKFPSQDIAAKYKVAKASPESVEAVLDYGRAVVLFCLASLLDTSCTSCEGGLPTYKPRSQLNTNYWPVIEDALPMLEPFMEGRKLDAGQMELLVETKGRLLWLAGRSNEEQALIDSYALAHSTAITVVKRRLEILRESGDVYLSESQCNRSRARMKSAPESARLDLLTACVALHPNNGEARSDPADYATYLPNLSPDEAALYRTHLAQHCVERAGAEEERCAEACACEAKDSAKPVTSKCKRACGGCRKQIAQELLACKKLGEAPPEPAPASVRVGKSKKSRAARGRVLADEDAAQE
jgi:hypothetical protein